MKLDFFNKRSGLLFPILILSLTALLYLPSINVHFINDELAFIQRNTPNSISDLMSLLDKKDYDGEYYRPAGNLVSGVLSLFAGYSVVPYRVFNVLLHALNGMLLYFIILRLVNNKLNAHLTALFGALFFISIPLNDYAVIWHTDLFDRLVTFFYLFSVLFFLMKGKAGFLSLTTFLFALLSKEMAFSLPIIIFLIGLFVYDRIRKSAAVSLPYFLLLILVVLFRWAAFDNNIINLQDAHAGVGLVTILKNIVVFSGMLLFPFFLKQTHDLFYLYQTLIIIVSGLVGILILFRLVKSRYKDRLFVILVLIIVVSIMPASRLLMRWYLYLPSAFFGILLSYYIFSSSLAFKKQIIAAISIFAIYYSYTLYRITDWIDISDKGHTAIMHFIRDYNNEINSAESLIFITIPAKVNDIPLFQLAFDIHLNHYLPMKKDISVITKSSIKDWDDKIEMSLSDKGAFITHFDDNYFILSGVEKSIKFNLNDLKEGKLQRIQLNIEKEPYTKTFTFSEGKFHLFKDYK